MDANAVYPLLEKRGGRVGRSCIYRSSRVGTTRTLEVCGSFIVLHWGLGSLRSITDGAIVGAKIGRVSRECYALVALTIRNDIW